MTSAPLISEIASCRLCADRFARTETGHEPRPVVWFRPGARILIAGQAPGARVHASGRPFTDPSGERLREWMGLDEQDFYDKKQVSIVPMAFCFPGYDANGSDLPPPAICAAQWRKTVMAHLGEVPLTLLVGGHAMRWHLDKSATVTKTVQNWQEHAPDVFTLPHPSWRNTGWIRKNPWFEADLIPALRRRVREVLG